MADVPPHRSAAVNRLCHSTRLWAACALLAAVIPTICRAQTDHPNTATTAPDTGKPYAVEPSSFLSDANYGMGHGGSYITFSNLTFSNGQASFTLNVYEDNFTARNSEGIFNAEFWVERNTGSWPGTTLYWTNVYPVNVNSATPPAGSYQVPPQQFTNVAPGTQFRVFGYSYVYNQGGGQQGEFALYSWMGPVAVPSPVAMTPPTSSNATITYGTSWAPTVSGGEGTGAYVYCVAGYTYFQPVSTKWNPLGVGTFQFYVGQLPDGSNVGNNFGSNLGEMELNGSPYTLTVVAPPGPVPTISVDGHNSGDTVSGGSAVTVRYGATDSTGILSGIRYNIWNSTTGYFDNGGGGYTATGGSSGEVDKVVTLSTPGEWYFWTDAIDTLGQTASTGAWGAGFHLTVTKLPQSPVSAHDTTIPYGQSFNPQSPNITSGGSGTGGWQFVIGGYTNFDAGASSNTGTNIPGSGWSASWTPPSVGTYAFWVVKDGDATYNASNIAGQYNLIVTQTTPPIVSIAPANSTITAGQSITFTASGGLYGYVWGGAASGSGTTQTVTFPNVGSYTVTVYSPAGGNYTVSNTATATITVNAAGPGTVYIAPASSTIYIGQSITFTASGGLNGYMWGSSASGSGTSQTVTFPNVGNYTVTVYSPAGGNYSVSNTATAMITVNLATPPTVYVAPASSTIYAGQSITFTASGGTNGYVWGGSASGSGTSQTVTFPSTGSYSVTVYSPAGGIYAVSNTATATITVNPPLVTASISANPTSGVAPASSTITWTSSNATSVSVSGTGLSSSNASGSQSVGPFSAGMYTYTITATGPGGSAAPTATFVVSAGFLTVSPSGTVQFPDAVRDTLALGPSNISGGAISSTKVFTLQNTGNAPLNITGIGLSGASSSCFTVQTQLTLPYALAPGASVQVTLVFTPGVMGAAAPLGAVSNTTFSVSSNVNTPPPVTIFGICRAPKISITWHQ